MVDRIPLLVLADSDQQCLGAQCVCHPSDIARTAQSAFGPLDREDRPWPFLAKPDARAVQVDIDHDVADHGDSRLLFGWMCHLFAHFHSFVNQLCGTASM
jgi:hypothetical protein